MRFAILQRYDYDVDITVEDPSRENHICNSLRDTFDVRSIVGEDMNRKLHVRIHDSRGVAQLSRDLRAFQLENQHA